MLKKLLLPVCVLLLLSACDSSKESTNSNSSINHTNSTSTSSSNHSNSTSSTLTSNSSSNNSSSTISSSHSSSTISSSFAMPTNINELKNLLENTSYNLALTNEISFVYEKTDYPQKYNIDEYGYRTIETVYSNRFQSDYSTRNISITKSKSLDLKNYEEMYTYTGKSYVGKYDNDYIDLEVYDISSIPENEYIYKNSAISKLNINENSLIEDYLISNAPKTVSNWLANFENIESILYMEESNEYCYYLTNEIYIHQQTKTMTELKLDINKNGFLSSCEYIYKVFNYDWNIEDFSTQTTTHMIEKYSSTYGEIPIDNEDLLINPMDYILTDATIGFIENNSYDNELLDVNAIKVGTSIKPFTISVTPSTALDCNFEILASSNTNVITNNYGTWKCLAPGQSTLTLQNSMGFRKEITVSVYTPELETITLSVSESKLVVGNTYSLYIFCTPYDAVSTYNVTSSNPEVAEIISNDTNYSINCKAEGNTNITVSSIEFPNIIQTISITVSKASDSNDYIEILTKNNWSVYSYSTYSTLYINFYEDKTGILYDDYGNTASFKWEIDNETISLSEFSFYYNYEYIIFINNTIKFSNDGSYLYANFSDGSFTSLIETFEIASY